jgi:hypothetical protein
MDLSALEYSHQKGNTSSKPDETMAEWDCSK